MVYHDKVLAVSRACGARADCILDSLSNKPELITFRVCIESMPNTPIGARISTGFDTANWIVVLSFDYRRAFDTEEADRRSVR